MCHRHRGSDTVRLARRGRPDARFRAGPACGSAPTGDVLPAAQYVGLDLPYAELRLAAARGLTVAQADAARLPVADAGVDAVVCSMACSCSCSCCRWSRPWPTYAGSCGPAAHRGHGGGEPADAAA
jgi:hypothetical protein